MERSRDAVNCCTSARGKTHRVCLALAVCAALCGSVRAMYPHVSFTELTHTADAIFVGTVQDVRSRVGPTERSIVTDVSFEVFQVVSLKEGVQVDPTQLVTLTFAGGQLGDRGLTVSGVPTFAIGERYIVFTRLDGGAYLNPLIGGPQGLFRLLDDAQSPQTYPLTLGGQGVAAVSEGEVQYSPRLERVDNGVATFALPEVQPIAAPISARGEAEPAWSAQDLRDAPSAQPMNLDEFIAEIHTALLSAPPEHPALRGLGSVPTEAEAAAALRQPGKVPTTTPGRDLEVPRTDGLEPWPFEWSAPEDSAGPGGPVAVLSGDKATPAPDEAEPVGDMLAAALATDDPRAALCFCGTFTLFLVMEQVPVGWWEWGENNDSMARYNHFMDIYRYTADDGSWGNNGQNEFGGYPSSQDLINVYGQGWNGALAVTWTTWSGCSCCQITQADVFFNPAYSWWQNLSDTLDQPGRVHYRQVVNHELGHSWGMQRGSCTEDYSYSQISVMHAYYNNIIEDGYGIHHPEAYAIRQTYSGQTPVIARKDVGVESYYASGSLGNSYTNSSFYYTGDPITVNSITVENNSNTATAGVRIRFFLSDNNIISTGDYQMGSYWYWDSFPAETYSTASYATTVPAVPAGQYYVGIIVSTDHAAYNGDDLNFNNATYLHDRITVALPPPGNDSCWGAAPIGLGTTFGTTAGATTDGSASCGSGTPDVWYSFTAPCSGTLAVDSCGSGYDTIVSVHTACPGSYLNDIACNDDCSGVPCAPLSSCLTAAVAAGNTYLIRVSGYNGLTGNFTLNLSYASPANDACSGAPFIYEGVTPYSNCGATTDGPTDCAAASDVWFVHSATCTGFLTVSLCGSGYDTYLGVYPYADGSCPPLSGTVLACEDDDAVCGLQSHLILPTTIGETYFIRVGGYLGATGEGQLEVFCGECGLDADCDDGDVCTTDACVAGTCTHDPVVCDDADLCTTDSCDQFAGCQYVPLECDDGLYCNGLEYCLEGYCEPGSYPCAEQWCDEDSDTCQDYGNGDMDFDGDVDLADFAGFQACFEEAALPFCQPANMVGDGTVDDADFTAFESVLTGP